MRATLKTPLGTSQGTVDNVSGGSSGFNNATQYVISLPDGYSGATSATTQLTLHVRVSCGSGHVSGTARLWYDDAAANSRLELTKGGAATTYYLHALTPQLSETLSVGPRQSADKFLNSAQPCPARSYALIKSFSMTVP